MILIIQLYQSYENIDFFKKRFHLYFSSLEAYTTVLRGIVGWFYLIKLHKYVLTLEILKCVYDRIVYLNILFQKRGFNGGHNVVKRVHQTFFCALSPLQPVTQMLSYAPGSYLCAIREWANIISMYFLANFFCENC